MKNYCEEIQRLKDEIIASIKAIFTNNGITRINIADSEVYVVWWDDNNDAHEGVVTFVTCADNRLSVEICDNDSIDMYSDEDEFDGDGSEALTHQEEGDLPLKNLAWLDDIHTAVLKMLTTQSGPICYMCGKKIPEGSPVSNGTEHFCSNDCLRALSTPGNKQS